MPQVQASEFEQESDTESDVATKLTKQFKLKVINHSKKSEYRVFNVRNNENVDLQTFDAMKEFILDKIPADVPKPDADTLEFGFITPGHGLKGRKEWLYSNEDVKEMIKTHKGCSVILWCYNCKKSVAPTASSNKQGNRSRSRSPHCSKSKDKSSSSKSAPAKTSRYESQMQKISAIDDIYKRLDEKQRGKYTPEQLRAWAHMIDLKKHSSYDEPPNKIRKRRFSVLGNKHTQTGTYSSTPTIQ